ncbi:MAG: 1-(5-phosphoribosyl)-5-[(5-phosphoribosylamino)methylideneamino]imidazole-4-carboxamide isomerase [Deltaproteobacteria bacterium]|nr:1-(5-phosphoribosyl)-5-[(5-phosphoribosylamino)methylideneamino]imidazole-4-carboxamide isomerase [Deltaproteobacteria bacterium]
MLIIPAIDIRGGKCVRLIQGDYNQETVYGEDPAAMAERWINQGAGFLHLVDLDGARDGLPHNRGTVEAIVRRSSVPVQAGGGIRDLATVEDYLSLGVRRVILGTAAFADPQFLKEACIEWPGRVAVDIAAKEGRAAVAGWVKETGVLAIDLARRCEELGASLIIYTDILRDGTQKGINLQATREMARALKIPVIASGGISTIADIEALLPLEPEGVCGVIVGKALYAGTLKLPEAIARADKKGD